MTNMIPRRPPPGCTASEFEVFDLIYRSEESSSYYCLHSLGLVRHERKEYAEVDFVIVGPAGIFCLEVKGGTVTRRGGEWIIGSGDRSYVSHKGPFAQAQTSRWPLMNEIDRRLRTDIRKGSVVGWGVIFPHVIFDRQSPEWDLDLVYDLRDKDKPFVKYIERLERYFRTRLDERGWPQPSKLGPSRISDIVDCLRGDFDAVTTLKGSILESRREVLALDKEQYRILDTALHEGNPRITCDGAAGTGKTVIACEAARRLAERGSRVLFTCFNQNLTEHLRRVCSGTQVPIRVEGIYAFMRDLIRAGGCDAQLRTAASSCSEDELFGDVYPEVFTEAAENLLDSGELLQFDALVIDEGQDVLSAQIMNCLEIVLSDGFAQGQWLIFLDSAMQSDVYSRMNDAVAQHLQSLNAVRFVLRENYRNPETIVTEMSAITKITKPPCKRKILAPVDYRTFTDEKSHTKKLNALLVELIREGIPPGEITILTAQRIADCSVCKSPPSIGKPIYYVGRSGEAAPDDAITVCSISAFKGLENEVIILTDIPDIEAMSAWSKSIIYVGMTRARTKLFIFVAPRFLEVRTRLME